MKKTMKLIAAALTVFSLTASAEEVLWKLDGTNAEFSPKHSTKAWFGDKAEMSSVEKTEDGFLLRNHASRYLALRPGTWLVFELVKAERQDAK